MIFWRSICPCCNDQGADDEERIIPATNNSSYQDNYSSGYGSEPRERQSSNVVPQKPKSAVEEEQDELRRILQRTEQEVIDVSNVDSMSGMYQYGNRVSSEYVKTMTLYEDVLKNADPKHFKDLVLNATRHLEGSNNTAAMTSSTRSTGSEPHPGTPIAKQPNKSYGSMDELSVAQMKDYLSQSPNTQLVTDFGADRQREMTAAIIASIQAKHQEDLVVHMNI